MPAAVTFGGIGSGMDVEGLITGLVNVEKQGLAPTQRKVSDARSAISSVGEVSALLAKLKTSASKLFDDRSVASYVATSSGTQVVATTSGTALPGSFALEVTQLASEQRTYSEEYASKVAGLGQAGSFNFQVGAGAPATVNIDAADSLESITNKINSSGLRVSASIFSTGSGYRLLVRGLDTGSANAITFSESGTTLGLTAPLNTVQTAQNAIAKIDGFQVSSSTNKIDSAIQGVSLALTAKTTAPITLRIESDPKTTKTSVSEFVDAFNAIVDKVQKLTGFGTVAAQNAALAGDSGLRGTLSKLSLVATKELGLGGPIDRLSDVGVSISRTGKLTFDQTKFDKAMVDRPTEVTRFLAGTLNSDGVMDKFRTTIDQLTDPKLGFLTVRAQGLQTRMRTLENRLSSEQARIDRYSETLRKQFSSMDATVAKNQALLRQIG